jgi:hypothetical protein
MHLNVPEGSTGLWIRHRGRRSAAGAQEREAPGLEALKEIAGR